MIIKEVVSDRAAWIVIHDEKDGKPGDAIGHARVMKGTNSDVPVDLDVQSATLNLYAMLYVDEGEQGIFEYPGVDVPLMVNGQMVIQSFQQRLK